jgi:hypothetical protein
MSLKIISGALTTCGVLQDGAGIRLDFIDPAGNPVSICLPTEQAEAIVMTLPRLLTEALKCQTGDEEARYVFPLGGWSLEQGRGQDNLMITLSTVDGFQVMFSLSLDACSALGRVLQREARKAMDPANSSRTIGRPLGPLN